MLVAISQDAARCVRTSARPPKGGVDTVRRGALIDGRCHLLCTLAEATALRDWLRALAKETQPARPAVADMLATAAEDVDTAITLDKPQPRPDDEKR